MAENAERNKKAKAREPSKVSMETPAVIEEENNQGEIQWNERDLHVKLPIADGKPETWSPEPKNLTSQNVKFLIRDLQSRSEDKISLKLSEISVDIPTAPIYDLNLQEKHQWERQRLPTFSIRIIRNFQNPNFDIRPDQVDRIYLIFNGLNELDDINHYHNIARKISTQNPTVKTAFIICPFPDHLTRHPVGGDFCEKPLDRFLEAPSNLFRQFLRFMLEMKWLLSMLVPIAYYPATAGMALSAEHTRLNSEALSQEILKEWKSLFKNSKLRTVCRNTDHLTGNESFKKRVQIIKKDEPEFFEREYPRLKLSQIKSSINTVRYLCGIESISSETPNVQPKNEEAGSPETRKEEEKVRPMIHLIGYSLGGFVAQSVFFAHPFAIASCSTICSGGPLKEISLTAFAHREEWQTVVKSLRDELQYAMIDGTFNDQGGCIIGMNAKNFAYFSKLFNNVFLREFPDSYKARVSEYVDRLFFVVGGEDPIIRPNEVLQTAPTEGIHLRQIAGLRHSLKNKTESVWFEDVFRDIHSFCGQAEIGYLKTFLQSNKGDSVKSGPGHKTKISDAAYDNKKNEDLSIQKMSIALKGLVEALTKSPQNSKLFIFRNDIPICLLPCDMMEFYSRSLHESDKTIREHIDILKRCQEFLWENKDRVLLYFPENIMNWFTRKMYTYAPTSESAGGVILSKEKREVFYENFVTTWKGEEAWNTKKKDFMDWGIRYFHPNSNPLAGEGLFSEPPDNFGDRLIVNTLPDLWILGKDPFIQKNNTDTGMVGDFGTTCSRLQRVYMLKDKRVGEINANEQQTLQDLNGKCSDAILNSNLRIIRSSRAKFNPRFQGSFIKNGKEVRKYLTHAGLILEKSDRIPKPEHDS